LGDLDRDAMKQGGTTKMRNVLIAAAALVALAGSAQAEMSVEQAEANFNSACRNNGSARDEACGAAMQYMYTSTIDALSDCVKEHPSNGADVVACMKGWGHAAGLE
jgi:hypothetical protein